MAIPATHSRRPLDRTAHTSRIINGRYEIKGPPSGPAPQWICPLNNP
jgi:hypothetical protein